MTSLISQAKINISQCNMLAKRLKGTMAYNNTRWKYTSRTRRRTKPINVLPIVWMKIFDIAKSIVFDLFFKKQQAADFIHCEPVNDKQGNGTDKIKMLRSITAERSHTRIATLLPSGMMMSNVLAIERTRWHVIFRAQRPIAVVMVRKHRRHQHDYAHRKQHPSKIPLLSHSSKLCKTAQK